MATTAAMTKQQKKAAIDLAWADYRSAAANLRDLGWSDYLDADERIWRRYLAAERDISAAPEAKAA